MILDQREDATRPGRLVVVMGSQGSASPPCCRPRVYGGRVLANRPIRLAGFMELRVGWVEYFAAETREFFDWLAGPLACQTWKHPVSA